MPTAEERRAKRAKRQAEARAKQNAHQTSQTTVVAPEISGDDRFVQLLQRNEDDLVKFVAKVNHVYQDKLKKDAPFMTFMLLGMQSAGKSTIMERFMHAVLNIVQEGTGTRCPLDTTCIHDDSCREASCDLTGDELENPGEDLSVMEVFKRITQHNQTLGKKDCFSTKSLRLVYRANNVQNMRFVDTPGIISTQGTGRDNREAIKDILRNEMGKANTKLCVLLEPKEFETNPIVNFCDETFGKRNAWINSATFMMTKYDKQTHDSRTGSKANKFFSKFLENKCRPHLVITPTLPKENLEPDKLYKARYELLESADDMEDKEFRKWLDSQDRFREEDPTDEPLDKNIKERIGFQSAKRTMRKIMLEDTIKRLPEVLGELRKELASLTKERKILLDKQKLSDPKELKVIVGEALYHIENRIKAYLDGDLESAMKFPDQLQTLEDEIEDEDSSEWSTRLLNEHTAEEETWRDKIDDLDGSFPENIQPNEKFLGGKQVQRAIEFFRIVMIQQLPDPMELKGVIGNALGFLGGGLQRENWEGAMVQVVKVSVKKVTHPGINYLVKHVGTIFRRLFMLAIEDVKQGGQLSATFNLLPAAVEKHFLKEFDDMLWELMEESSKQSHLALEPMESNENGGHFKLVNGAYVPVPSKVDKHSHMVDRFKHRLESMVSMTSDLAKSFLLKDNESRAEMKRSFLPDERTSMATDEEKEKILKRSFQYIVALMEFNLINLRFQLNHYLYDGFKTQLEKDLKNRLMDQADWSQLVEPDPSLQERLEVVNERIESVQSSLVEVERLQRKM